MGRKTISIEALKNEVNRMLAESVQDKADREGMIAVLENVLIATDNYKGYRYLSEKEVPAFALPGIRLNDEAFKDPDPTAKFKDTDHTRVHYL